MVDFDYNRMRFPRIVNKNHATVKTSSVQLSMSFLMHMQLIILFRHYIHLKIKLPRIKNRLGVALHAHGCRQHNTWCDENHKCRQILKNMCM